MVIFGTLGEFKKQMKLKPKDIKDIKEGKVFWNALTVVALTWQLEKLSTKNGITKQNPTLIDVGYVSLVVIDLLQENIQFLILSPLANKVILIW